MNALLPRGDGFVSAAATGTGFALSGASDRPQHSEVRRKEAQRVFSPSAQAEPDAPEDSGRAASGGPQGADMLLDMLGQAGDLGPIMGDDVLGVGQVVAQ